MHDLTGKSLYLAVRCDKNNQHIIPLKVVQFQDDGSNAEAWGGLPPFDVTCEICHNSQKVHRRSGDSVAWTTAR